MEVRRTVPVKLDVDSDTPHADYLCTDEYETTGAELHQR